MATLFASNWWISTIIWGSFSLVLGFWLMRSETKLLGSQISALEGAIRHDRVAEVHVLASEVVEIKEEEDEGPCWLFQLTGDEFLVLSSPVWNEMPRFPNDEFSVVDITIGKRIDRSIDCRGKKLEPSKRLPPSARARLMLDDDMKVIKGSLSEFVRAAESGA